MNTGSASLLSLDGSVLALVWPPERIVLGLRVSSGVRRTLLECVCRVALTRSPTTGGKEYLELSSWSIKNSLSRFQGEFLELLVTVRKSPVFMKAFLPALSDVMSSGRCATLVHLELTGNRLSSDNYEGLLEVLGQGAALTKLVLRKNKLDFSPHFQPLTDGLQMCTRLTHLDLSQNEISDQGLDSLSRVLRARCLCIEHLDLGWNRFSSDAVRRMAPLLGHCTALTELNLEGNAIGDGDDTLACITQHLQALQSLVFADAELHPFQLVSSSPSSSLQRLDLRDNSLEHAEIHALQEIFMLAPSLTHLDLCNCKIGSASRVQGSSSWKPEGGLCDLAFLDMTSNGLGRAGMRELSEALTQCPGLTHLSVRQNAVGDDGALSLAHALPALPRLTHLDVANNVIRTGGSMALAAALAHCSCLAHVHLKGNLFGLEGLAPLAASLARCPSLASLDLCSVGLRPMGSCNVDEQYGSLAELLQNVTALSRLALDDNIWLAHETPRAVKALEGCQYLTSLALSNLRCGTHGLALLCAGIATLSRLLRLSLSKMPLFHPQQSEQEHGESEQGRSSSSSGSSSGVAHVLCNCKALRDLDLSEHARGRWQPEGDGVLLRVLRESSRLHRLSLAGNNIVFTEAILDALSGCVAMRDLDLSRNDLSHLPQGGGAAGLCRLVRASTALVRLRLQGSLPGDGTGHELERECRKKDVHVALRMPSLFGDHHDSDDSGSSSPDSDDD